MNLMCFVGKREHEIVFLKKDNYVGGSFRPSSTSKKILAYIQGLPKVR